MTYVFHTPLLVYMSLWSNWLSHLTLTEEIVGSNPIRDAKWHWEVSQEINVLHDNATIVMQARGAIFLLYGHHGWFHMVTELFTSFCLSVT